MDIYLLRHGRSTANEARLVCGASDYPLSEQGLLQAAEICQRLKDIPFTRIYSSPLSRATQTVAPLDTALDIKLVPELVEVDTGSVSHITVDELWEWDSRYKYQGINAELRYPQGECLGDMLRRVARWYSKESECWNSDECVLISGHEGTVCGVLHFLLDLDIRNYPTFVIGNCEYVHISINQDEQLRYRFYSSSGTTGASK